MKAAACLLLAVVGVSPAFGAATDADKNRELTAVQSRIQQVGTDIKNLSAEKAVQHEELRKIEKQSAELADSLEAIRLDIRQQEENLRIVRGKVSATQKNILAEQRGLEGLVKSAYAIGNQSGLKGVLNLRDPSLSGRMQVYYDYVGKARLQKLLAIQEDFKTLQQLEAQKDQEARLLQVSLGKKQQETEAMQALKNHREKLLAELDGHYQSKKGEMQNLIKDEKKLTALVASLQKTDDNARRGAAHPAEPDHKQRQMARIEPEPQRVLQKNENESFPSQSFENLQGQLPWPIQGAIAERFGSRRSETFWDGTVINAGEGADIHAVAAGRVVYAKWLSGYGLMTIVDHGKGYMSLYGFNQSLYKNVGDHVAAGDALATVGHSGGRSQAALYFGLRKNGRPVNPEHWCRKP
jgi:septal ring factor EnvC (AmiA/AmiB activator)